jgi:hypothetical protein
MSATPATGSPDVTTPDTARGLAPIHERHHMLVACGALGLAGGVALMVAVVVGGMLVPDYNWISDTISDAAAGEWEIVTDVGLYCYAGALIACAVGAAHAHLDRTRWSVGVFCLTLLALCVTIIANRNEYGDGDNEGVVMHIYFVVALGVLFAVAPLTMAKGAAAAGPWFGRAFTVLGVVWIVLAPPFFFLPTGIDGAYERGLGAIAIGWTSLLSWILLRRGLALARHT